MFLFLPSSSSFTPPQRGLTFHQYSTGAGNLGGAGGSTSSAGGAEAEWDTDEEPGGELQLGELGVLPGRDKPKDAPEPKVYIYICVCMVLCMYVYVTFRCVACVCLR